MPQSIEANVKPSVEIINRRLRPKRPTKKPVGGVMIADAVM